MGVEQRLVALEREREQAEREVVLLREQLAANAEPPQRVACRHSPTLSRQGIVWKWGAIALSLATLLLAVLGLWVFLPFARLGWQYLRG
jgi:hypothetical protein